MTIRGREEAADTHSPLTADRLCDTLRRGIVQASQAASSHVRSRRSVRSSRLAGWRLGSRVRQTQTGLRPPRPEHGASERARASSGATDGKVASLASLHALLLI
eukprot:CAMPEP_0185210206 /NCGR_PEP_ID=MMETSP1140-20130426/65181_1 /TAXON_ID=298111 /ORGANISM="Pavlova sp., Strain CCMP459" /LENGTH=103 /DNA_ID=CAMNT_0027778005 /DNA_START=299 /DNA_END=607 /DNA_ORIENTATION=-